MTVDRCIFMNNGTGMVFDGTSGSASNSFMARNTIKGFDIYASTGFKFEFNTVADNPMGLGPTNVPLVNSLLVRNGSSTACTDCPGSIVTNDITNLHLVSPDAAPYDYHIMAGSMAIDAAQGGTLRSRLRRRHASARCRPRRRRRRSRSRLTTRGALGTENHRSCGAGSRTRTPRRARTARDARPPARSGTARRAALAALASAAASVAYGVAV